MSAEKNEIVVITTDASAFNATGLVFEEAHKIQLTQEQSDKLRSLKSKGQLVVKIILINND